MYPTLSAVWAQLVADDESEAELALQSATVCTILSPAGPKRSRYMIDRICRIGRQEWTGWLAVMECQKPIVPELFFFCSFCVFFSSKNISENDMIPNCLFSLSDG
jgi:hypothetical protein